MDMERIEAHVAKQDNECWLWTGFVDKTSPMLRVSQPTRKLVSARRYAYEIHNQVSVPSRYVVTNICKNSICVNPSHLTAQLRGTHGHRLVGSWNVEHCKRGHEFSIWNTGKQPSGKICLACDRSNRRRNAAKRRAEYPEWDKTLRIARRAAKQEFVSQFKTKCNQCGESEKSCLDFHHIDPTTKVETVAMRVYGQHSEEAILEEIKKCILLCSNCHRKLHAAEREAANIN